MGIKRYIATKDNTITNAFKSDLSTRGSGSNMGASDILEVFSIYAQATTSSIEKSRILLQFPTTDLIADKQTDVILSASYQTNSGKSQANPKYFLRLFNAEHAQTLPKQFEVTVKAVSRSWDEGIGLDMDEYKDLGSSNWVNAASASGGVTTWTSAGADFHASPSHTYSFVKGTEDLELDITTLVNQWLDGTKANYGLGVFLSTAYEDSTERSYYTKKFFGRGSEFFFKRPCIEARWKDAKLDDRGAFYASSSLAPKVDNLNTLYFYNYIRGQLKNIEQVGKGNIYVHLYSGSDTNNRPVAGGTPLRLDLPDDHGSGETGRILDTPATGGWFTTGIYTASLGLRTSLVKAFDVWHVGATHYKSGTIEIKTFNTNWEVNPTDRYITSITNLKDSYNTKETAKLRLYIRSQDWNPNIYTKAITRVQAELLEQTYYSVYRESDDYTIISYGTSSATEHTRLSYDISGNYFDLDMSLFEPGYAYGIKFLMKVNGNWKETPETFRFRVDNES